MVALTGLTRGRLEKAQHDVAQRFAGGLVLHIEEVPGAIDHAEVALAHMLAELAGIFGGGVFVTITVDEHHRDIDVRRAF
ncbi:hypothetical protein D3C80_2081360 [compost metagenome]